MAARTYLATTWYDPRVVVATSHIAGGGMFASDPIDAGEIVAVAGGIVMSEDEFLRFTESAGRWNAMQIGEELHLVDLIQRPDVVAGSINHSCDSNLWLADEASLVARRDIAAGEELTLDYALTTVQPEWVLDQPCACTAVDCRGVVTGNDWLLGAVQAKYRGHFAPFINARISARNLSG